MKISEIAEEVRSLQEDLVLGKDVADRLAAAAAAAVVWADEVAALIPEVREREELRARRASVPSWSNNFRYPVRDWDVEVLQVPVELRSTKRYADQEELGHPVRVVNHGGRILADDNRVEGELAGYNRQGSPMIRYRAAANGEIVTRSTAGAIVVLTDGSGSVVHESAGPNPRRHVVAQH